MQKGELVMKALPMRGKLTGKRIAGYLWAGPGKNWMHKENYFQLEDSRLVTAVLVSDSGSLWIRCLGATFRVTLKGPKSQVLSTAVLALPGGKKASAVRPLARRRRRGRARRRTTR
jgi:hypothetical protein